MQKAFRNSFQTFGSPGAFATYSSGIRWYRSVKAVGTDVQMICKRILAKGCTVHIGIHL
ncbi:hypothetical protein Pint_33669 [Pistacia integerrima]|uniref:Uncharacterized protein n=1 Tax=Pistacia integerrima TaxID=434235 RepID=A0ACC0X4Z0_9ROSI|nr:hypothetical protein Pint_33669 [Pistacia integerrima]